MTPTASANSAVRPVGAASYRGALIGAVVLTGLLLVLFWDFFSRQMSWAIRQQADWGHTVVIPLIAGYFVYLKWRELSARRFKTTWVAFLPIVLGMAIYMISALGPPAVSHHNIRGAGVCLTIFGLVLLFSGFRAMIWLWFPLLYLFVFGQTISDRFMEIVTFKMQNLTARGAHVALLVIGMDVDREGNTITLFNHGVPTPLNIAEACSGMRMLMAFLALGVAMAYTGLPRVWQRVALVIMGVPTAIFVNILRVMTLGLLAYLDVNFAAGDFHSFVGLVWLVPAFLVYLGIMWIIRNIVSESGAKGGRGKSGAAAGDGGSNDAGGGKLFDGRARVALILVCLTLVLGGVGLALAVQSLNVYLKKKPVDLRDHFDNIALTLGRWETVAEGAKLSEEMVEELGTDLYLDRQYALDGDSRKAMVNLHLAYYTGMIDAVPHVPDRCLPGAGYYQVTQPVNIPMSLTRKGWAPDPERTSRVTGEPYEIVTYRDSITGRAVTVRMPIGAFELRTVQFSHKNHPRELLFGGYFFIANGRVTSTPEGVKRFAFIASEEYAYYCKVQILMAGPKSKMDEGRFVELAADFIEALLPELMRCLPDWADVEARMTESTG